MNERCFILDLITPRKMVSLEISSLRLVDDTGSFGVHNGHCDFLTLLVPAIGTYYDADGAVHYLATDGGIFKVVDNRATLISGEIFEDHDPKRLAVIIHDDFLRRDSVEHSIAQMIEGIENSFFEKITTMGKEKTA